jgi:RAB protein geranylgeranyltransferase component A
MELSENHYNVIVVGTGMIESLLGGYVQLVVQSI